MKNHTLVGLIFFTAILVLFTGCALNSKDTQGVSTDVKSVAKQQTSLQGTYKSVTGVMDPLSCYCVNGGYLTTKDSKKIPICFENIEEEIKCDYMMVQGSYKTKKNNPEPTNPCPAGEREYFNVSSYSCN
jgi:hypothetical protein